MQIKKMKKNIPSIIIILHQEEMFPIKDQALDQELLDQAQDKEAVELLDQAQDKVAVELVD